MRPFESSQLPSGTITFLFSDIEGSTRLLQQIGEAAFKDILEEHRRLLRSAFAAHGGHELNTEGDSFFVAFSQAGAAAAAATDGQLALASHPWPPGVTVRVRMGLHTGEALLTEGDYVGLDVHRAARIAGSAHGGQVILSQATRSLLASTRFSARDLGEHRLKDLSLPEHLFQLNLSGLPEEFPPLRTLDAVRNNLPISVSSFVGREQEVARARDLLGRVRLLTFTGPGGTGKTRLSLQVAAEVADQFHDGVFWVPLAPLADPALVRPTIAQSFDMPETPGPSPFDRLLVDLRSKSYLIVLDNFEQVLLAAPAISEILRAGRSVKVIATTREVLRLSGEQEFPVPPLHLPQPGPDLDLGALMANEAVALFVARAMAVRPDFALTADNAGTVLEVCRRLDGLPLAIELASARIRLLTPDAILARLSSRLTLLSGGARDAPERQRTLRGAIAWSHDLLDAEERRLFARLAVFVGGAEVAEIEAVCGPPAEQGLDPLEGLASLVDKSLVRSVQMNGGEPRFEMLETIREFALEQLAGSGEQEDQVRRRHASGYLELAERAQPRLMRMDRRIWLDRLDRERGNLRVALAWSTETGETELALRLIGALWRFWHMRGPLSEGIERATSAIELPWGPELTSYRIRALEAIGSLYYWRTELARAHRFYSDALRLARGLGDPKLIADSLYDLAFAPVEDDRFDWSSATEPGMALLEEALRLYRDLDDRDGIAGALWVLGQANFFLGRRDLGRRAAEEALELYRAAGNPFGLGWALYGLGMLDAYEGALVKARASLTEALELFLEAGDSSGLTGTLDAIVAVDVAEGYEERAVTLAAASAALSARIGTVIPINPDDIVGERAIAKVHLPATEIERLREAGSRLSTDEAVALALNAGAASGSATRAEP